jgi:hypothetical protein
MYSGGGRDPGIEVRRAASRHAEIETWFRKIYVTLLIKYY